MVETDAAGRIVLVNEGFRDQRDGGTGDRLVGTPVADLVESVQRAEFTGLLAAAARDLVPVAGVFGLAAPGLPACPVRVLAAPIVTGGGGTPAGLRCVFTDISGELRLRQQQDRQRSAAAAITEILRSISTATEGEMDAALARALVSVGSLATIDRCFVARLLEDGDALRWDFCWAAEGVEPRLAANMPASLSRLPWLAVRLRSGQVVHIEDVAALPMDATLEKEHLLRQEIRSSLTIPVFDGGRVAGLLAFQSVRSVGNWRDEDVRLLETVGQILAGAWQRRRADRERAAAQRRLADTVAFLPDATFVVDEHGQVLAWNRALEELTGVPGERVVGQGGRAHAAILHGEDVPDLVDLILDEGSGPDSRFDLVEIRGETLCAERFLPGLKGGRGAHVWLTASPLRDPNGRLAGAIESIKDITDRKLAEQALRRSEERVRLLNEDLERRVDAATAELRAANAALRDSEERHRRIIENLGDRHIFYSLDLSLRFTFVSSSFRRLTGLDSIADLERCARTWLADPRNAPAVALVTGLRAGRRQPPFDVYADLPDGSGLVLEIHSVPVLSPGGEVLSIEGVARDVTEDRRNERLVATARERLLEAEKMAALGAMVAGVSHEMATPVGIGVTAASHLAALCGDGLQSLGEGSLTRSGLEMLLESMRQAAGAVQANLGRAADLILNFKQVAVDQSSVQERDFDLAAYLDEIELSLRPRLKGTGHRLTVDCPAGIVLHGDPGALYRVIVNLVMNSLEHGFDGFLTGSITLAVRRGDGGVVLEYRDDGNGMTAEQRQRLYEPFYTTRRGRGGTGLGMHIVWTNVTQVLGGTITCASAPGRGTRFTVAIPQHVEASHA
ncbi:MAG: PAS domain S-box protein [Candidatus Krumholzibacteriia bacterium]